MSIGSNIKNLRELNNLTQSYMAEQLGMSVSGYGKIERNETELTITKLKAIAKILKVDSSKILDFDKNTVFNIYNNKNASGIVQNQQINDDKSIKDLVGQLIQDNQTFKNYLAEIIQLKSK